MLQLVEIRTERLVLTPLDPDLVAALLAGDFSVVNCGEGWPHADTRDGLSIATECGGWLVTRSGLVIGDCGLVGAVTADGDVEIGYGLALPSRGLGLGSELVKGLSDWLLESGTHLEGRGRGRPRQPALPPGPRICGVRHRPRRRTRGDVHVGRGCGTFSPRREPSVRTARAA